MYVSGFECFNEDKTKRFFFLNDYEARRGYKDEILTEPKEAQVDMTKDCYANLREGRVIWWKI
jgi:hypothetical protein